MGYEKLTKPGMKVYEMIDIMSEGNPGAMQTIIQMLQDPSGFMDLLSLDSLDIRGTRLYMLYSDCCDRNIKKFKRTLQLLRYGVFSHDEIMANLNVEAIALPFIDDELGIEGIPSYDEDFIKLLKEVLEILDPNSKKIITNFAA